MPLQDTDLFIIQRDDGTHRKVRYDELNVAPPEPDPPVITQYPAISSDSDETDDPITVDTRAAVSDATFTSSAWKKGVLKSLVHLAPQVIHRLKLVLISSVRPSQVLMVLQSTLIVIH